MTGTDLLHQPGVRQRTWHGEEKSILSFRSGTACAATARWAGGLSKIHTRLDWSKASVQYVFQRKRWGKRFRGPSTWQCVTLSLLCPNPTPQRQCLVLHDCLNGTRLSILKRWGNLARLNTFGKLLLITLLLINNSYKPDHHRTCGLGDRRYERCSEETSSS